MGLDEFCKQLSLMGAQQIDYRNPAQDGGVLRSLGQLSFLLPVIGKTIVGSIGQVQTGEYFQLTPTWTMIKEPVPEQFISQIEDLLFGASCDAEYGNLKAL